LTDQTSPPGTRGSRQRLLTLRAFFLLGAVAVFAAASLAYAYLGFRDAVARADRAADQYARERIEIIVQSARHFVAEFEGEVSFAARMIEARLVDQNDAGALKRFFFEHLQRRDALRAIYIGNADGSFDFVRRVADGTFETRQIGADLVERSVRIELWSEGYEQIAPASTRPDEFDPRERPWYRAAAFNRVAAWSPPYAYWSTGEIGLSFARVVACPATSTSCILGVDLTVETLVRSLDGAVRDGAGIGAFVRAGTAEPIAVSRGADSGTMAAALAAPFAHRQQIEVAGQRYLLASEDIGAAGVPWTIGVYVPRLEFADWMSGIERASLVSGAIAVSLSLAFGFVLWRRVATGLAGVSHLAATIGARKPPPEMRDLGLAEIDAVAATLRAMDADLTRHARALEKAMAELVRSDQAKTEFLAQLSHELRTPLNAVVGFAGLLRTTAGARLNARELGYLDDIAAAGGHQLAIIEELLEFARAGAGRLVLARERVDLAAIADVAARMVAARAQSKGLDLALALEPGLFVSADATKLRQICVVLIDNAVKFTPRGGRVDIACGRDAAARCYVRVADTGIGMTADELAAARKPFMRVAPSAVSIREGGVGLGLPIAQALADLHGADLVLESAPGRGTVATLVFPVAATA